ncbi:hypothetical protein WA158_000219 [Blastocystis sp. Blastoise]
MKIIRFQLIIHDILTEERNQLFCQYSPLFDFFNITIVTLKFDFSEVISYEYIYPSNLHELFPKLQEYTIHFDYYLELEYFHLPYSDLHYKRLYSIYKQNYYNMGTLPDEYNNDEYKDYRPPLYVECYSDYSREYNKQNNNKLKDILDQFIRYFNNYKLLKLKDLSIEIFLDSIQPLLSFIEFIHNNPSLSFPKLDSFYIHFLSDPDDYIYKQDDYNILKSFPSLSFSLHIPITEIYMHSQLGKSRETSFEYCQYIYNQLQMEYTKTVSTLHISI